jgi:hypothetical protein
LPTGFYGWAQITGANGTTLAAQVLEQRPDIKFTALVSASANTATTLSAPTIFNNTFGGFYTGANIVNPNVTPITINITYYDNNGVATNVTPFSVPAFGIAPIFHGDKSGNGLPVGGFITNYYGSAQVTSQGGGMVMVVNESGTTTQSGAARSGTYTALPTGSLSLGLPIVTNNGNPGFGGALTTGATILNLSNQTITGSIQYYLADGSLQGTAKTFTINAHASLPLYQGDPAQSLPSGFSGSAIMHGR